MILSSFLLFYSKIVIFSLMSERIKPNFTFNEEMESELMNNFDADIQ